MRASDLEGLPDGVAERLAARLGLDRRPLRMTSQAERSRERNREIVLARLERRVADALAPRPAAPATRPTRAARERRLADKARRAAVKAARRPAEPEADPQRRSGSMRQSGPRPVAAIRRDHHRAAVSSRAPTTCAAVRKVQRGCPSSPSEREPAFVPLRDAREEEAALGERERPHGSAPPGCARARCRRRWRTPWCASGSPSLRPT